MLCDEKIIKKSEIEIYEYGFLILKMKIFHVIIILLTGILTGHLLQICSFFLIYNLLRKYSGGFHAKSIWYCYLLTFSITGIFFCFYVCLSKIINVQIFLTLTIAACILGCIISPQDHVNKRMSKQEKKHYKKCSFIIYLGIVILTLMCTLLSYYEISRIFGIACIIHTGMSLINYIIILYVKTVRREHNR